MHDRATDGIQKSRSAFAARLNDLEYDELQVLGRQIEKLTEHPGWQAFVDLLDWRFQRTLSHFIYAEDASHAEYLRNTGQASGIEQARWLADVVLVKAEEARELAAERAAQQEEEQVV